MSLYAAYACNEGSGSVITDHSGNGRDMAISGSGNSWVTGHGAYAAAFEGATSGAAGATWDGGSTLAALSGDVTVMAWYQDSGASTAQAFVTGLFQSSGTARLAVYAYRSLSGTAASPQFTVRDNASNLYSFGSNGTDADNSWHHVACVYHSSGSVDAYLDGTLIATFTTTGAIGTTVRYFSLGNTMGGSGASVAVQDVRVFDQALTSTDITTYMATPVVSSGVSGTGSAAADKARVSGTGGSSLAGSGSAAGVKARLAGTGSSALTGSGSAAAVKGRLSGAGHPSLSGTGGARALQALLSGTGHPSVSGSGSAAALKASLSGFGSGPVTGSGGARAHKARTSGSSAPVAISWPDVELALCDLLTDLGTCGTETLPDLASSVPYIRVTRTGGSDDLVTDTSTVSIDVLAVNASDAKALAERVRQRLVFGPFRSAVSFATEHGRIDRARTVSGPTRLPPTDSGSLRMVVASYQITMRRQALEGVQ